MNKEEKNGLIIGSCIMILRAITNIAACIGISNLREEIRNQKPDYKCAKTMDIETAYDELYDRIDYVDDRVIMFGQEIESNVLELLDRIPYTEYSENMKKCEKILSEEE